MRYYRGAPYYRSEQSRYIFGAPLLGGFLGGLIGGGLAGGFNRPRPMMYQIQPAYPLYYQQLYMPYGSPYMTNYNQPYY